MNMVFAINKLRQNNQIVSRIQSIWLNSGPVEVSSSPSVSEQLGFLPVPAFYTINTNLQVFQKIMMYTECSTSI